MKERYEGEETALEEFQAGCVHPGGKMEFLLERIGPS